MIVVSSEYINGKDVTFLKKYCRFVLSKFVRTGILRKTHITIKIIKPNDCIEDTDKKDLIRYHAWCTYDKVVDGKKYFTVILNANKHNKKAKRELSRLKNLLLDVGHELVHIKQYLNGEMFAYSNGDTRYKGSRFDFSHQENEELYFDSPWEIEAYGRELGLYKIFCTKLKEDSKKKKQAKSIA